MSENKARLDKLIEDKKKKRSELQQARNGKPIFSFYALSSYLSRALSFFFVFVAWSLSLLFWNKELFLLFLSR